MPSLVSGASRGPIESAVGATDSGRAGRLTVVTADGWTIGTEPPASPRLDAALESGASSIGDTAGGIEVVTVVATGAGTRSAIRVFVPSDLLHRGQQRAWTALAAVAVTLILLSVLVADRLARSIVAPTQRLAAAARRLGGGDLGSRVDPEGPPELVELSGAFNSLGAQVSDMLARERELVAELSHRLRTPLTKLRMRVENVSDPVLAAELHHDVDDLSQVVTDVITEARNSLGSPSPRCDAAAVVAERVQFWTALAEDQSRPLGYRADPGPLTVAIGASDLAAALDVLLDNAFTHAGDDVPIAVDVAVDEATVRITVGDGGPGFEPAALTRGASGAGSTGLGLDIARTTAEHAGGRLELATSALGGAQVALLLPVPRNR